MILERLTIHSFAGLSETAVTLAPGLNLISGPNEAGKSTLYYALQHVLFTPADLSRPAFRKSMERFLPLGGGDTISVDLDFTSEGKGYTISKSWGELKSGVLTLPDGSRLTGEKAVGEALHALLPAPEGTVEKVFLTYQSGLADTLEELKNNPSVLFSFSDLLKTAVLESGGVSLSRFQNTLEARLRESFNRWDRDHGCPEGNRGVNNHYKKDVGRVCAAYYEKEGLAVLLDRISEKEEAYREISGENDSLASALEEIQQFLSGNEGRYRSAREEIELQAELETWKLKEKELKTASERWPAAEEGLRRCRRDLEEKRRRAAQLKGEEEEARKLETRKKLKEQVRRVRERVQERDQVVRMMESGVKVEKSAVQEAAALEQSIKLMEHTLKTGSLRMKVEAKKAVSFFSVTENTRDEISLEKGEVHTIRGKGFIQLESDEVFVFASSGETDMEGTKEKLERDKNSLRKVYETYGVKDLDELERHRESFEELKRRVRSAEENLVKELQGETPESLEEKVRESGADREVRPLADIVDEKARTEEGVKHLEQEERELKKELEAFEKEYGQKDLLFEKAVQVVGKKKELEEKLSELEELPLEFTDAGNFIEYYENKMKEKTTIAETLLEVKLRKAAIEDGMIEESSEEVARQLEYAEIRFRKHLETAEALETIRLITREIIDTSEQEALRPFEKELAVNLERLTLKRYHGSLLEQELPAAVQRSDGIEVPYRLLSAGTKDVLSIALRLVMAGFYLGTREGFLVMDDPLVDMDPERQKAAASLLTDFAEKTQVIIFTCHPSHAALFGNAKTIELSR